ncbi:MAG TPA: hypothetical protein VIK01_21510 [Polyangiaceae bacterium]
MKTRYRNSLPLFAALAFASSTAHAQSSDSAVAQALFDHAKQLMAAGHVAEACPKLEESERLDPRSGTLINLASCYEQTARLASAWSTYIEAATSAKALGNSAREAVARQRAAALAPRLAKLLITVAPALKSVAGLEITRDGVVVREPEWGLALPADAGPHEVTAKAPGHASFDTKVKVTAEGSTTNVSVPELALQATPQRVAVPARLSVMTSGERDIVAIDGKVVGSQHWEGPVTIGEHMVRVTGAHKKPYESRVQLLAGSTRSLQITLEDESHGSNLWLWVAGGAAVAAGAAVGGYFLLKPQDSPGAHPEGKFGTAYLSLGGAR